MKKVSLVFTIIAVLSLVIVGACGGDNGEAETTAEQTTTTSEASEPSGGDGELTWNDMPIYGGADQIQKGSMMIPADEGDYSKVEWRYYETGDDVGDVIDFYKDEMPDNGWANPMWMETAEVAWTYYTKNDEKDMAMIWIAAEEGNTVIAMMRAAE